MSRQVQNLKKEKRSASLRERPVIQPLLVSKPVDELAEKQSAVIQDKKISMSRQVQNLKKEKRSASLRERPVIQPLLISNPVKNQKVIRDAKECQVKTNDAKTLAEKQSAVIREKARTFSTQQQKAQQSLNLLNYERLSNTGSREEKLVLSKLAMKNLQALQRHGNNLLSSIQAARKAEAENFFKERKYKWRELILFLDRYATTLPLFLGAINDPRASQLVGGIPMFESEMIPVNSLVAAFDEDIWLIAKVEKILASDRYLIDFIGESDKDKAQFEMSRSQLIPLPRYRAHAKNHRDALFPKDAIVLAKWPTNTVFYKAYVVSTPSDEDETYHVNFDFDLDEKYVDNFNSPEVPQMFVINYIDMAKDDKPDDTAAKTAGNKNSEPQSAVGGKTENACNAKTNDLELEEDIGDACEVTIATAKGDIENHHDSDFSDVNDEDGRDPVLIEQSQVMTSNHIKAYHEDFDSDIEENFVGDFYSPEVSQMSDTEYLEQCAAGGGTEKISKSKNDDSVLHEQLGGISKLSIANPKDETETHQDQTCGVENEHLTESSSEQNQNSKDGQCKSDNKVSAGRKSGNSRVSKQVMGQLKKCNQCSFSSSKSGQLVIHMRSHDGVKIYECDQCSYITDDSRNLNRHMRQHTGETLFTCNQCSYSNTSKVQLDIHMRSHDVVKSGPEKTSALKNDDSVLQEKQLVGDSELSIATVKGDIETHDDIIKSVNNKHSTEQNSEQNQNAENRQHKSSKKVSAVRKSSRVSNGRVSKRRVSNGRVSKRKNIQLQKCEQCSYITNNSSHLKRHVLTHTGEKPFKCNQCSFAAIQKVNLETHIRIHHA